MLLRCDGLFWLESNGSRKPYVQTLFKGHEVSYVPAELLNMLVPGSTYRNTDRFSSSTSKSFFSKVTTTSGPMRGLSGSYWLELHFEIGPPARIRLHELARVLFFHNAHLFRAATRPDGLSSFASAFIKDGDIIIKFPDSTDYPKSFVEPIYKQEHLAWLLSNQEARSSFLSIYQSWLAFPDKIWPFNFTPPSLVGWEIEFNAWDTKEEGCLIVEEVTGLNHPDFGFAGRITIDHLNIKKKNNSNKKPDKKATRAPLSNDESDLDLTASPAFNRRVTGRKDHSFRINFNDVPQIKLVEHSSASSNASLIDTKNAERIDSATGLPGRDGSGNEFRYELNTGTEFLHSNLENGPDNDTEHYKKLCSALKLVNLDSDFTTSKPEKNSFPEPATNRSAAYTLVGNQTIPYYKANLSYRGMNLVIIDVDRDFMRNDKSLSTLVLGLKSEGVETLYQIMQDCSDNGVGWNREFIGQSSVVSKFCKHPFVNKKIDGIKTPRTEDEYVEAWAKIFKNTAKKIYLMTDAA